MHQAHLIVSGKVQGVFYRASCQEIAVKYGLKGWVKNISTGQVEVLAQGEKEKIEKLIEWCKKGPPNAKVSEVKIEWKNLTNTYKSFEVI